MKVSIVIPAHNEKERIGRTLTQYCRFFLKNKTGLDTTFLVVLNGCTDNTIDIVKEKQKEFSNIEILDLKQAGKGLAVTTGFKESLKQDYDLIGFVDADMATEPQYFYELIENIDNYDVIFASRYMKKSKISPARPWYKRWGRELIFNPLVRLLIGINFRDFQCGAKLFKRHVLEKIVPEITMKDWAFDVELLYLSKKHGFSLYEHPTVWYDQAGSKFEVIKAGSKMLGSIIKIRWNHLRFEKK